MYRLILPMNMSILSASVKVVAGGCRCCRVVKGGIGKGRLNINHIKDSSLKVWLAFGHRATPPARSRLQDILIPVLLLALIGGCSSTGYVGTGYQSEDPTPNRIVFSKDNKQAAYIWTDRWTSMIPFPPCYPISPLAELRTERVGWINGSSRNYLVSIESRAQVGGTGNAEWIHDLSFSPDGGLLAIAVGKRIVVFNTDSGRREYGLMAAGEVTALLWPSSGEVIYVTDQSEHERKVYRQTLRGRATELSSNEEALIRYQALNKRAPVTDRNHIGESTSCSHRREVAVSEDGSTIAEVVRRGEMRVKALSR